MMTTTKIRTRYQNHPGSNVGAYVATGAGRSAKLRTDQSLSSEANHRRAAEVLAGRLGARIIAGGSTDARVYVWTLEPVQLCGMHNCGAPVHFVQADGEAPGVGRWAHDDAALDYSPTTGRGHAARIH